MNVATIALIAAVWLAGMFVGWALVHGAQILRRQEAALLAITTEEPATIQPMTPEADQLPAAA